MRFILIIVVFCIATHFRLDAQYKSSFYLNEENGLAGNLVKDISKSRAGEIWIGTDNGLTIFDGKRFQNYYKEDGLPSNKVWAIAHGLEDTTYLGCTEGGLAILNGTSTIKVLHYSGNYADKYRTLLFSKTFNSLFVGTEQGLFVLWKDSLIELNYEKEESSRSVILSISEDGSNILFTVMRGTREGCYRLKYNQIDPSKSSISRITLNGRFSSTLIGNSAYCGQYNRLTEFDLGNGSFNQIDYFTDTTFFIWEIEPYKGNMLWLGGLGDSRFDGGIRIFDIEEKKFLNCPFETNSASVNAILYDNAYDLSWFGTDEGVFIYQSTPFEYYSFPTQTIIDIEADNGDIFVATKSGLFTLNGSRLKPIVSYEMIEKLVTDKFNLFLQKFGKETWRGFDSHQGVQLNSFIKSNAHLYINTSKGTLNVHDLKKYLPFGSGSFAMKSNGQFYLAVKYVPTYLVTNPYDFNYTTIEDNPKAYQGEITEFINADGTYYCPSYTSGLLVIRNDTSFRFDSTNSTLENNLVDAAIDTNGHVWVLSLNGSLYKFGNHIQPEILEKFDLKSLGCLGRNYKWLSITKGILFVATNHGLNAIPIKSITAKEGAFEYFFNRYNGYNFESAKSPVTDDDGNLWVCNKSNIIKINPDLLKKYPTSLYVKNLAVNGIMMQLDELNGAELPYDTKEVSFSFNACKYPSSNNIISRFKLNNGDWIQGNEVVLSSLRSGNYTVTLEVFDNEYKGRYQLSSTFSISKPFWNTLWFLALALSLIALLGYRLYVFRINRIKKSQDEKTKLLVANAELQLRSLQGQMNPHFIFNALTSLQNFILEKDTKSSLVFLNNLSSIIRTNLENATEEYIDLIQELSFLNKYAEIERFRFKEKVQITISNRVEERNVLIPPMLVQPLIENSIKHGMGNRMEGGLIQIDFSNTSNQLIISVTDNGVGRLQAMNHKIVGKQELGISILRKRLDLLNELNHTDLNQIKIIDQEVGGIPTGTVVEIRLKLIIGL